MAIPAVVTLGSRAPLLAPLSNRVAASLVQMVLVLTATFSFPAKVSIMTAAVFALPGQPPFSFSPVILPFC